MQNTFEAVIFDLDGVICHTDEYHYLAWKKACDEAGIPFDESVNNRLRGVSRLECVDIILERYTGDVDGFDKDSFADKKNGYYTTLLQKMDSRDVAQTVDKTLKTLKARKKKMAIASSSRNARFILERLGLTHYFDAIVDGTMILKSKPAPEVFLKAAEALGTKPDRALVVEDAHAGVQAGRYGGFAVAGIGDASSSSLVSYKLESLTDLLGIGALL